MNYKAFLFDLNGTLIDDMDYHIRAWHRIFNSLGADLTLEQTKAECYGKNHEAIERVFPGRFSVKEKDKMSIDKETEYQHEYRPHLKLLAGLDDFLKHAKDNKIKMAIGSAAIMYNIDFVLNGLNIRHYFDAIVSADDVARSKPDPETFTRCAELLNVSPKDCLVFEDAPKGVEAADNAGMDCIVLTTMHSAEEFQQYKNIKLIISDFTSPEVNALFD